MNSLVGFTVYSGLSEDRALFLKAAQHRVLSQFAHLDHKTILVGDTYLEIWGRGESQNAIHTMPDGSVLALIGSPQGQVSWQSVERDLFEDKFQLPWDGRVILLRVSADGKSWTMWNDWLGSIPVYYAEVNGGRIASTLEPVIVASAGFTADAIFKPGLVSLLINGHFLSDWTLFKGMKTAPPDCIAEWTKDGFHSKPVKTVAPTEAHWETSWDDLVDEMYELSREAVGEVLKTQSKWILPLSAGLDSRLIAAVGADLGIDIHAYAWGEPNSTDVVYSRQIAKTLGFTWKHIDLSKDFLIKYTPQWADMFGSAMHFHGMYQMAFLDAIDSETNAPIVTGFIGDVLAGSSLMQYDTGSVLYKKEWYKHWTTKEAGALLKFPIDSALQEIAEEIKKQTGNLQGSRFTKTLFLELWSRQRFFTNFQATLTDYWNGVATPFLNRKYARFCMSLPRVALENRRLLGDVFRLHYGRLAVIPGTYATKPLIVTGKYLVKRRIAQSLPDVFRQGLFAGFDQVPLRMDIDCIQATGKDALWPMYNVWDQLGEWVDVSYVDQAYQAIMESTEDIRPLRKLQSIQTLAYRLSTSLKELN